MSRPRAKCSRKWWRAKRRNGEEKRFEMLEVVEQSLKWLREWVESCRETFHDKYTLVLAEVARIEGRDLDAMRLYEEAIQSAGKNGFIQNEAIAHEVAARFYLAGGFEPLPKLTLETRATAIFVGAPRQGAADRSNAILPHRGASRCAPDHHIETPVEQLDLGTVMKVSQAVSGEIVLEQLVQTLMVIAVEHAGAERGLLILPYGEEYRIAAEARTGRGRGRGPAATGADNALRLARLAASLRHPNTGKRDSGRRLGPESVLGGRIFSPTAP